MANRLMHAYLSWLPFLYGLLITSAQTPVDVFITPRVYLLFVSIVILVCLKVLTLSDLNLKTLFYSVIHQPTYRFLVILFGISIAISAAYSPNPAESWFGQESFRTGAIFMLMCAILFLIYSSSQNISFIGIYSLIIFLSIITILEYIGFRPLYFLTDRYIKMASLAPYATIGQRGHLAGILIIFSVFLLVKDFGKSRFMWSVYIASLIAIGCTSNTSSIFSIFFSALIYAFIKIFRRDQKISDIIKIFLAPLLIFSFIPLANVNKILLDNGIVSHASSSKDIKSGSTFESRKILWKIGAEMTASRPILGWGPQTFRNHWYDFVSREDGDKLFRIELNLKNNQKMIRINDSAAYKNTNNETVPVILAFSSPHNATIDLLYSQGIIGFLTFLLTVIALIIYIRQQSGINGIISLIPFVGYGVYLQGWFITVPATGLAVMLLGMIISANSRNYCLK